MLSACIITSVVFLAPGLALLLHGFGLGLLPASVVSISLAGAVYGATVLLLRKFELGFVIGLLVTMTVGANVPIGSQNQILAALGPQIWLVHIPLVGLLGLYLVTGRWRSVKLSWAHLLLAGAVGWMLVAAPLSAGPRTDLAVYFALHVLQAWLVFFFVFSSVQRDVLTFQQVAVILTGTTAAHAVIAVLQVLNRDSFGLTFFGDVSGQAAQISLGVLGVYPIGKYVSGFAGGGAYSSLMVFGAPLALVFAYRARGWQRVSWSGVFILLSATLRFAGWDAGRGSYLVTMGSLIGAVLLVKRQEIFTEFRSRLNAGNITTALITGFTIVLWPSSVSGSQTRTSNVDNTSNGGTNGGSGGSSGSSPEPEWDFRYFDPDAVISGVENLSVPLFNLSNLGVRIQQYVAGLDLFLQYPVFGIGGANFYFVSQQMGVERRLSLHNMYIALLAETGLAGFLLYVGAVISTVYVGVREALRGRGDTLLILGALSGIAGFSALMMFQVQMLRIQSLFLFWAVAGGLIGHVTLVERE